MNQAYRPTPILPVTPAAARTARRGRRCPELEFDAAGLQADQEDRQFAIGGRTNVQRVVDADGGKFVFDQRQHAAVLSAVVQPASTSCEESA